MNRARLVDWSVRKHVSRSLTFLYEKSSLTLTVNKFQRRMTKRKKKKERLRLYIWKLYRKKKNYNNFGGIFFFLHRFAPNNCLSGDWTGFSMCAIGVCSIYFFSVLFLFFTLCAHRTVVQTTIIVWFKQHFMNQLNSKHQ